ncbi:putative N-acetylated-alpha-linked acidic dipeptidase [Ptychodera flava]|uniref:putative N-acetylated-alpha-linked acidic dipeptidase n=1 Tax=Ptychodera flava TaxID=63121 RepID=UPI003969CC60
METSKDINRARKVVANWRLILATLVVVALVLFAIGIIIGYFIGLAKEDDVIKATLREADESISNKLMQAVKAENIRANLEYLTEEPHLAGTPADKRQADYIVKLWLEQGLDHAEAVPYNVLLSYPSSEEGKGNKVEILNKKTGANVFTSKPREEILDESQDHPDVLPPYSAYSAAGEVEGKIVYANYARVEDFFYLQRDLGIDLNGTIIIARYGKIFRGDKVFNAMDFGAASIILYSDPEDIAPAGEKPYPDGIFLPETGVQRGTTFKHSMDPLTPGYPATGYAFRIDESEAELPRIPIHPIGYGDAKEILKKMKGDVVKEDWHGEIPEVTYRYGPGLDDDDEIVKVSVYSSNERRTSYNTIGMIRGSVEPDRYVLLGNHRDAWIFGAIDPSSGTASIMEATRVFGDMVKSGWRPRRTLVFCTWGAEEYGLIGSNEWVEENMKSLIPRGVAYINVDAPLMGIHYLRVSATPNLKEVVFNAARKVPDPNPSGNRQTFYDTMITRAPKDGNEPLLYDLGSGSDYASFLHRMGMSAIDMTYRWDTDKYDFSMYPMYHSVYETFHLVETFYDPQFKYLQGMTRMWIEVAWQLADSLILPFNCEDYGIRVKKMFDGFSETDSASKIRNRGLSLDTFGDAVSKFKSQSTNFHKAIANVDRKSPMDIRRVNDQLMALDRAFMDPLGLTGRPYTRHVIFAPSSKDMYASAGFPGLIDALFDIDNSPDPDKQWKEVEREIAIITYHLYTAANTMGDLVTSLTRNEL